jgi:signal transduction histidine kinase
VKSAFLGAFSQPVGGPLATLRRHAELLAARRDLATDASESADAIAAASSHLLEVLHTLLDYADVQGGRLSVRPEVVDLARLARGVVADFATRAEERGLTLGVTADEELAPARTDPRLARVLLANLVGHAVDGCSNGTVGVAVSQGPQGHLLRVRSAGRERHATRGEDPIEIRGPGARGSGAPGAAPGLGLGLAIVRHVADTLGAIVEVTPDEPTRGDTLVTVVIPRAFADDRLPAKLTG